MQPGKKLPCHRAPFPMRRLRDFARRYFVQVLSVRAGKGLADLRKVTIVARKEAFHLQVHRRLASLWGAVPGPQEPQQDTEEGNRQEYRGNRQPTHGFSSSSKRSLKARSRRFTAGDNSL